jgi:hypothetical protein
MKLYSSAPKIVFVLASTVVIIGFSAFSQKGKSNRYSFRKETRATNIDTPAPRIHDRYLTEEDMNKIEASIKKLEGQMEKLNEQMNKMYFSKSQREVDDAMQKIDFEKVERQMNDALKKIDFEKLKGDIRESVNRFPNAEMLKAQMENAKAQMENAKVQMQLQKGNMALNNENRLKFEKEMRKAQETMMKAREEFRNLKEFTDQLEKDGLIDKSKSYKIEVKSGELYINDKKQIKEVNDRYRKYYRKNNFTINSDEGEGVRV